MRNGRSNLARFLLILCAVAGCTGIESDDIGGIYKQSTPKQNLINNRAPGMPGHESSEAAAKYLYAKNTELLRSRYAEEYDYLRSDEPPKLGIAFSGGGLRSASTCIGVLKGLYEAGVLEHVDVISSVSGGSYASYWFFSQHYYNAPKDENDKRPGKKFGLNGDIFKTWEEGRSNLDDPDSYRYQLYLEQSSSILSIDHRDTLGAFFKNGINGIGNLTTFISSIPLHFLANGLFDWEVNLNPLRKSYQNALDRTYGFYPNDYKLKNFENAESVLWVDNVYAKQISFMDMRNFLMKTREEGFNFPYFIINTTGHYSRLASDVEEDNELGYTVFEFTPWQYGSGLFPYRKVSENHPPISVSKSVSISGAAVDSRAQSVDIAGRDKKMSNLGATLNKIFNIDMGYSMSNHNCSKFQRNMHLLLPWPLYMLHDWFLDDTPTGVVLSDGGHSENLGLYSLVRRGVQNIIVVDAEHDPYSMFTSAKRLKYHLETEMGLKLTLFQQHPISVFSADESVFEGEITGLPDEKGDETTIHLIYIKLSLNEDRLGKGEGPSALEPYSYWIRNYKAQNRGFPQQSTVDIVYGPDQVKAYRDLGYDIVKNYDFKPLIQRVTKQ